MKFPKVFMLYSIIALLLCSFSSFSYAAYQIDSLFNGVGFNVHHNAAGGNGADYGLDVIAATTDNYLVVGLSSNGADADMTIWRYNEFGNLDNSFDGDGIITFHNSAGGNGLDNAQAVYIDKNGKILVTGRSKNQLGKEVMTTWRLNNNGSLDTTFNGTGILSNGTSFIGGYDSGRDIIVDGNDNIFIAGQIYNGSSYEIAVWKILSNGTLDSSFNGNGLLTIANLAGGSFDVASSIDIDDYNNIVIAGWTGNGTDNDLFIIRLKPDSTFDNTFSGDGIFTYSSSAGGEGFPMHDAANALRIDAFGNIVAAGRVAGGSLAVLRLKFDGTLDSSFDSDGILIYNPYAGKVDEAFGLEIDSNNNLVVAGSVNGRDYFMVGVLNYSGAWGSDFNNTGVFIGDRVSTGEDIAYSVGVDNSGRIIAAGRSENQSGDRDMIVYRFSDPSASATPTTPDAGASGGGGCFIATAAYGSYLDSNVRVLRYFRDDYLLTNPVGRALVEFYYSKSPPLAEYIGAHEYLRSATRWALTPLVYGVKYPGISFMLIIGAAAGVVIYRKRRPRCS